MAARPPSGPGREGGVPKAYLSLIAVSFSELRKDMRELVRSDWEECVRLRAHELAATLAAACDRQGLAELAGLARSLAHLARMTREQALPLRAALGEKSEELLAEVTRRIGVRSRKNLG